MTPLVFAVVGLYRAWRGQTLSTELQKLLLAWITTSAIFALALLPSMQAIELIHIWGGLWFLFGGLALVIVRLFLRTVLRRLREAGWNVKRIVLVGGGPVADRTIRQLQQNRWAGFDIIGVFADEGERWPESRERRLLERPPTLGGYSEVGEYLECNPHVDQLWFALPLSAEETIRSVLQDLKFSTIDICYVPDIFGFDLLNHSIAEVAGLPLLNLRVSPLVGPNRILKLIEDRLVALLILIICLPFMLVIAACVRLESSGPVIYTQRRHGWDGKPFTIYKFRSMRVHVPENGEVVQAGRSDSRVTKVGSFLRRTSLDELPQFINVLQGRMSVVGPRPHAVEHGDKYKDHVDRYMLRHKVKPGITGWAQVNGFRGETETVEKMQQRIELDLEYIENWSLGLDLKIILKTIVSGFMHPNAY